MKLNLRRAISSASVLAIAGGVLAATASIANAATTPPWEPDPQALGTLTFYNSAGQVVTSGTNLTHLFDFAQASSAGRHRRHQGDAEFAAADARRRHRQLLHGQLRSRRRLLPERELHHRR